MAAAPLAIGAALCALAAGLCVGAWVAVLLRLPLSPVATPVALAAAVFVARRSSRGGRPFVCALLGALGLALAGALIAGWFFDVSWDGQAYHQEAVLRLAAGWNPLWSPPLSVSVRPDDVWINHYPKAIWLGETVLFQLSGHIEAAKALGSWLAMGAGLVLFAALRRARLSTRASAVAAVLAAGNPITLAQVPTFYADGVMASLMITAVASVILWVVERRRLWLVTAGTAVILLVGTKFTGLVYAGLFCGAGLVMAHLHGKTLVRSAAMAAVLSLGVGTLVVGADSYVLNTLRKGHPFYPLMGQGAVDIITPHATAAFHAHARIGRLALSAAAPSSNLREPVTAKWPWSVTAAELRAFSYPDVRIGGFGPLFGLAALLAAMVALLSVFVAWPEGRRRLALVGLGGLALSVLVNPAGWWARYVPQLWLGLVALWVVTASSGLPALRWARRTLAVVMLANAALVAFAAFAGQSAATHAVDVQLRALAQSSHAAALPVRWNGFESNRQRLQEHGIAFVEVTHGPCGSPTRLVRSLAEVCSAVPTFARGDDKAAP